MLVLQKSWICQTIAASQNLRMFVPRVYGLGDLSQIIDERAYAQAASLLSFLDDNLSTFVITDAYNRAAEALRSHGFVLLLGEPAVGKTVIAATLAVTALDSWGCRTILADDPDDLIRHWNPYEKQFICVDDAFGMLRHDRTLTNKWGRRLPKVMSAIRAGTKVVMTSRDYIYREARPLLKEYAFPLLREQQVTVDVASLSQDERRQIVYNHVKLGNQPKDVRRRMKPYLADAADGTPFRPEMARRLGRREFTPSLQLCREGVLQFMSRPVEFLAEVYSGLDSNYISALALVYSDGDLAAPLSLSESQTNVLGLLGSNLSATAEALVALEGAFLRRGSLPGMPPGAEHWSFRHPTLREGFASFIGNNPNLVNIFVRGLSDEQLLMQVDCGSGDQRGTLVTLPPALYEHVADRLADMHSVDGYHGERQSRRYPFLATRSSRQFLELYLARDTYLIDNLVSFGPYLSAVPEPQLLARLHREGLLPEEKRKAAVRNLKWLALEFPDAGWLDLEEFRVLMTRNERRRLLRAVRRVLVPNLDKILQDWRDNEQGDIRQYYRSLQDELSRYARALSFDRDSFLALQSAIKRVDLRRQEVEDDDDDDGWTGGTSAMRTTTISMSISERSLFDDVDE